MARPGRAGSPRVALLGYRVSDMLFPTPAKLDETAKITLTSSQPNDPERCPRAFSVGAIATDAVRPIPDNRSPLNIGLGAQHRFCGQAPKQDKRVSAAYLRFARTFIKLHLPRLKGDEDLSTAKWLEHCDFTQSRKAELQAWSDDISPWTEEYYKCKTFVKHEMYDSYKYPRLINSRHDRFKSAVGPAVAAFDELLFSLPFFVKHEDPATRPLRVRETFASSAVYETDHTAFERALRGVHCKVEYEAMKHCLGKHPDAQIPLRHIRRAIFGTNLCKARGVRVEIKQTRMSGDQWTSSGNGLTNLLTALFVLGSARWPNASPEQLARLVMALKALVEGDDALLEAVAVIDPALYERLGLTVKMVLHTTATTASFCGVVSDPVALTNVQDPAKILASFGWLDWRWSQARDSRALSLLRAKAMSYLVQFPDAPIISEFCHYVLRATRGIDVRWGLAKLEMYHKAKADSKPWLRLPDPPLASRELVARLYGITTDSQQTIEDRFKNADSLANFSFAGLGLPAPAIWADCADKYIACLGGPSIEVFPWSPNPETRAFLRERRIRG